MDVREAVQNKANYGSIVEYFKELKVLSTVDLVLLVDVIDNMSEEIFEHYKALCDMCRGELQRTKMIYQEAGDFDFLTDSQKSQLAYAIKKAGDMGILLAEKYEDMAEVLSDFL